MFSAALRSVAQKGAELARQLADDASSGLGQLAAASALPLGQLSGFKFQRDYRLGSQTGTAGAHGIWRIFAGTARSPTAIHQEVSIWVLDKRELASRGDGGAVPGGGPSGPQHHRWDAVLEQQRHGCTLMTRLKHPGVVRVVLPLEENSGHMVLVTESVLGCLRDVLLHRDQAGTSSSSWLAPDASDPPAGTATTSANGHGSPSSLRLSQHGPQYRGVLRHAASASGSGTGLGGGEDGVGFGASGAAVSGPSRGSGSGSGSGLSLLEVKLGLLELAEVLTFLHGTARMAHCGLCPQSAVLAADGGWKLAVFSFAVPLESAGPGSTAPACCQPPYQYDDPFPQLWDELAKPQLPYTAPELVVPPGGGLMNRLPSGLFTGGGSSSSAWSPSAPSWAAADAFSLGALSYELVAAATGAEPTHPDGGAAPQLLPVRCSVQQYGTRLAALAAAGAGAGGGGGGGSLSGLSSVAPGLVAELGRIPSEFQGMLLTLVSPSPGARPAPAALSRCSWFEGDSLLRALRFLDGMMQSDLRDKLAFLVDFANEAADGTGGSGGGGSSEGALWRRIPDRMLTTRVLPTLLQEVRTGGPGAGAALPVALAICRRLGRKAFASIALPVLTQVMDSAGAVTVTAGVVGGGTGAVESAAMLTALVGQSEALAGLMDGPTIDRVLLPMILRAVLGPAAAAALDACPTTNTAPAGTFPLAPAPPPDPRLAQAALSRLHSLVVSGLLDGRAHAVRSRLLPALHAAAGRTTSAGVRTGCLGLMAALAAKVDMSEGDAIITSCAQLLSVDTSGGTLVAVAALAEALAEAPGWGPPAAAQRLVPLLVPHLLAPSLGPQHLGALVRAVQALLSRVVRYAEEAAQLRAAAAGGGAGLAAAVAAGGGTLMPSTSTGTPGAAAAAGGGGGGISGGGGGSKAAAPGAVAFTRWTGGGGAAAGGTAGGGGGGSRVAGAATAGTGTSSTFSTTSAAAASGGGNSGVRASGPVLTPASVREPGPGQGSDPFADRPPIVPERRLWGNSAPAAASTSTRYGSAYATSTNAGSSYYYTSSTGAGGSTVGGDSGGFEDLASTVNPFGAPLAAGGVMDPSANPFGPPSLAGGNGLIDPSANPFGPPPSLNGSALGDTSANPFGPILATRVQQAASGATRGQARCVGGWVGGGGSTGGGGGVGASMTASSWSSSPVPARSQSTASPWGLVAAATKASAAAASTTGAGKGPVQPTLPPPPAPAATLASSAAAAAAAAAATAVAEKAAAAPAQNSVGSAAASAQAAAAAVVASKGGPVNLMDL